MSPQMIPNGLSKPARTAAMDNRNLFESAQNRVIDRFIHQGEGFFHPKPNDLQFR